MSQTETNLLNNREALERLGIILVFIANLVQFLTGGVLWLGALGGDIDSNPYIFSYTLLLIAGGVLTILGYSLLNYDKLNIRIEPLYYTIFSLVEFLLLFFLAPTGAVGNIIVGFSNFIGLVGVFLLLIALRPNFGPIANKKIYQAVAGILSTTISIFFIILGIYVCLYIAPPMGESSNIKPGLSYFAGNGTFPENLYTNFIQNFPEAVSFYQGITMSGFLMIITALFVLAISMLRNKITLKIASMGLLIGIIWSVVNLSIFSLNYYVLLDGFFYANYMPEYKTTLELSSCGVIPSGIILTLLYCVTQLMMFYASFASKPIQSWRRKRDSAIAAAEVFFREGKLPSAIKYLERAAELSSKIDEEDQAIEILTKIKQIKDKSIKMKKAEAAEKAKKSYEKQKKKDAEAAMKAKAKGKVVKKGIDKKGKEPEKKESTALDKEIEEKMRKAMDKKEESSEKEKKK
ncbi:MAG: hypothetical protein GY870_07775 [archaeon]|nr:hypothetical protein [archaeon]